MNVSLPVFKHYYVSLSQKSFGDDFGSRHAAKNPGVKLQVMMIVWSASHVLLSASIRAWKVTSCIRRESESVPDSSTDIHLNRKHPQLLVF